MVRKMSLRKLNFSKTEQIFHGTQAFASPTDMASSGVWENIVLSKTPTFDGVCGMLIFTVLILEIFCQMLACLPICYVVGICLANFL